jgi:hypothetical protein
VFHDRAGFWSQDDYALGGVKAEFKPPREWFPEQ